MTALTTRAIETMGERIVKRLDAAAASVSRDALAKNLYAKLFDWLVAAINRKISAIGIHLLKMPSPDCQPYTPAYRIDRFVALRCSAECVDTFRISVSWAVMHRSVFPGAFFPGAFFQESSGDPSVT